MKWLNLFLVGMLALMASIGFVAFVLAGAMFVQSSDIRSFVATLFTAFIAMGFAVAYVRSDPL